MILGFKYLILYNLFVINPFCLDDKSGIDCTISPDNNVLFQDTLKERKKTIFPGEQWEVATPESQGVNASKLKEAIQYLEENSGLDGVKEVMIIRNGYLIWEGQDVDKVHGVWSVTKSFTSSILGLFLNQGNWDGQQLIPKNWVQKASAVQVPATLPLGHAESGLHGSGVYGFNWWVNGIHPNGERKWPDAPIDTFAAWGHNNNHLFIIPEWDMVIVRLGLDQSDKEITEKINSQFIKKIGEAIN